MSNVVVFSIAINVIIIDIIDSIEKDVLFACVYMITIDLIIYELIGMSH